MNGYFPVISGSVDLHLYMTNDLRGEKAMSLGWAILFNGVLGGIVFLVSWPIFMTWCCIKFGDKNTDDGFEDTCEESSTVGEHLVKDCRIWKMFAAFCTIFLWEIEIPLKYLVIYTNIRETAERSRRSDDND